VLTLLTSPKCRIGFAYDCITFVQYYFADKKRDKKKRPKAEETDETARVVDKRTEKKQEVESGSEEAAVAAYDVEDEGENAVFSLTNNRKALLWLGGVVVGHEIMRFFRGSWV